MDGRGRILIDGFNLDLESGTGVATYARNLSFCIHRLGYGTEILYGTRASPGVHELLHEIAFFDSNVGEPPKWLALLRRAREMVVGLTPSRVPITGQVIAAHYKSRMPYFDEIWNVPNLFGRPTLSPSITDEVFARWRRLRVRMRPKPDIVHWTFPLPMFVPGTKNVYVIHDLVPLRLPFTTLDNKRHYFRLVRALARKADHIITVSETSRKDIINLLGVPEWKITNTYQSVEIPDKYMRKSIDVISREIEGTINIKVGEYMLFFGAIEPKKNIGRLIEAYLASNIDTPLVIVGKIGWKSENELRLLHREVILYQEQIGFLIRARQRIWQIDYAPFSLLVSLIRGAKSVLFPSLYEGFGLPIVEAMKLGTPVLTSTEGSSPEVAGDSALLVDPYDTRAIAEGIIALDKDAELRSSLSAKGRKRAELFSPEAHSCRLDVVYRALLDK
jgi:glycosyltransferase involved in cell wall biosynthesis